MARTKTPAALSDLRKRVAAAIKEKGLYKTAARVGVKPETLQRFALGGTSSHKGTIALIERTFP